jgi:hypothetical protein
MRSDVPWFLSAVILLAGLISASCNGVAPAEPTAPTAGQPVAFAVEPARVTPEFLPPGLHCGGARAFRTHFAVILGSMPGVTFETLHVGFSDRFGAVHRPIVLGVSRVLSSSLAIGPSPVPLPTSSPIPFPTTGPNNGLPGIGTPLRVPVVLEFGCLVRPHGTIVVTAGTRDRRGRLGDHRLTIDVG